MVRNIAPYRLRTALICEICGRSSYKTCRGVKAKIEKSEYSFIHFHISTYGKNTVYNYVEFRSIRACCSNYRGAPFARLNERHEKSIRHRRA